MMAFILFGLKSVLVLGAALLLARCGWLAASVRHLVLAVAILSLPAMVLVGELEQRAFVVEPPEVVKTWDLAVQLPVGTWSAPRGDVTDVGTLTAQTAAIAVYGLVCGGLLMLWLARILRTERWVRKTAPLGTPVSGVQLRQADCIDSPVAWGLLRPQVVVPGDWNEWSDEKRRVAIVHELAHVRRFDSVTSIVSGLVCCLFWVNPLVWLAYRRMLLEAELACDDAVVNAGIAPTYYASQLLDLARARKLGIAPAMAVATTLPRRIRAILDSNTRRSHMNAKGIVGVVILGMSVVLPLGSIGAVDKDELRELLFSPDGEIAPIVKVAPVYPVEAKQRGIEGYALVEFTVTETGDVDNPVIVESDPPDVFDRAALAAVQKFKYKPRVVDGVAVAVPGIRNRIAFALDSAGDSEPKKSRPESMAGPTFDALSSVQRLIDAEDLDGALDALAVLQDSHGLNDNEIAQVHNMRGFVYFSMSDYARAIEEYETVVALAEFIPDGLETVTLFSLAQLCFVTEEYDRSLDFVKAWMAKADDPGPVPFIFIGQIHYQMNNYPAAIDRIEEGVRVARERDMAIKENWWGLLSYLYFEEENWAKVVETLEVLQDEYPSEEYAGRLSAVRAMLEEG